MIRKIYYGIKWRLKNYPLYFSLKKEFSGEYASIYFQLEKEKRKNKDFKRIKNLQDKKDQYILNLLYDNFSDIIEKYISFSGDLGTVNKLVWTLWWTGEDSAPDIVKCCLNSIREQENGNKVIVLDKNSYSDYVQIPKEIIEKHEKGIIKDAHFSDIIRAKLLSEYGGIWLDATILLTKPLPNSIFEGQFYTCKTYDENLPYFSKSRWTGFCLAGAQGYPLYLYLYEMLVAYWLRYNMPLDYLLMDYIIYIGFESIPVVKHNIESLVNNNPNRNRLMGILNRPYSDDLFELLSEGNTFLQKLSWRYGKPTVKDKDGNLTNYGFLCKRYLNNE